MTELSTPPLRTSQRAALVVALLSSFLGPFMGSSVNVALPSMGHDLSMSAVLLGWVNTAFLLASATFSIPFGRLGDIYGRKKIYMTGVFLFTIASVLIALSRSATMVIAWRVLQGIGASMIFSTGMAILISVYPPADRGKVLGLNVAAVYLGLSSGPFVGGIITQHLGWRFIFWLNLPAGLFLLFVIFVMLKGDWAEAKGATFDLVGSLLLGLALFLSLYAFSRLPRSSAFVMLGLGIVGLVLFAAVELKRKDPVIDIRLFRDNKVFAFSSLAALINYAATFAVGFLLSLYLQKVVGLSPQRTGLVLVCQPLVQAIFSPLAGRLSDRMESRTVASVGMGVTFVGLVLLIFVRQQSSIVYILGCLVFLGFGFALFSSPNTNAVMGSVERQIYGVASAVVGTMRQMGMMFSMGIVMMVLSLHLGSSEIRPDTTQLFITSMRTAYAIFAVLCFGGIFASLARGKMSRAGGHP